MHKSSVHAGKFTGPNNLKQLERPNFTNAEGLVKFGLHLTVLWINKKSVTFVTDRFTDTQMYHNKI